MTRLGLLALALAAAAPAYAAEDGRIVTRRYDPAAIVRVQGQTGIQATITFAEDERIENVAVGDSAAWQVTPNKRANLLFVKPMAAKARTNMTVVTDRRIYLFDLVAAPAAAPLYAMRFTYPDEPKPKVEPEVAAAPAPAAEPAKPTTSPATLNFAWKARGSRQLFPARTFDDGNATYLAWPADAPIPAILARDAMGSEGPVNFTVQEDTVIVEGVPALLVLRSGKEMATLEPSTPREKPKKTKPAEQQYQPGPDAPAQAVAALAGDK